MAFDIPMLQARIAIIKKTTALVGPQSDDLGRGLWSAQSKKHFHNTMKNLSRLAQIPHSDFETFKADFHTFIADAWRIVRRSKKDP